MKDRRMRG